MQELVEFASNNALLVTGLIASGLAAVFYELRLKAQNIASLGTPMVVQMINEGGKVVDVRTAELFAGGHIVDARNMPQQELLDDSSVVKNQKKNVVLVCDNGTQSGKCVARLRKDGHENVFSLRGGLEDWRKENLPLISES